MVFENIMDKIFLLIQDKPIVTLIENTLYRYEVISGPNLTQNLNFDLCIIDTSYFFESKNMLSALKKSGPSIFLPILAVIHDNDASSINQFLGNSIDETIRIPFTGAELKNRVQSLLKIRHLSIIHNSTNPDVVPSRNSFYRDEDSIAKQFLEYIPVLCCIFDLSGGIMHWNTLFEKYTGFPQKQIPQLTLNDLFKDEDRLPALKHIQQVVKRGQSRIEIQLLTNYGNPKSILLIGKQIKYNGKNCVFELGVEAEHCKKIEDALRESETKLRLFIEHAPAALAMFDRQMRYLAVSKRWISDFYLQNQQIIGKSHYDIFPEIPEKWKSVHQRSINGEVISEEEESFTRSDGSIQWLRWEVRPWYTAENTIGGIVIFSEDITPQKVYEEKLASQKEQLTVTLRSIGEGVIVADVNGLIQMINSTAEKLTGWTQESALGKPLESVYNIVAKEENHYYSFNSEAKNINETNHILITKGGHKIDIADNREPIIDINGHKLGTVVVFRNITERKKFEYNLQTSLSQKEILLQELYHRTRNNMQVISSILELQATSTENSEVQKIIRDSLIRIQTMALAQENIYRSRNLTQINMKEYITALKDMVIHSYNVPENKITFSVNVQNIELLIDIAIPCGLLIAELVTNSLKYAFPNQENCQIEITLQKVENPFVELVVGDNGVGMPYALNIQNSDTLGIKLVYHIVKHQLHGDIRIEYTHGLWYFIRFPTDIYSKRV